jgi:arginase
MNSSETSIVVLDAPSNLGLRPPAPGAVPGVYKLAGALRDNLLLLRLQAADGGVVLAPRYHAQWEPGDGVRNEAAIERFSQKLADRLSVVLDQGAFPVVLGGDCSILLGNMLALRRRGRYGLVFIDGHSDFRHPGNSEFVGAAAGEDLALVTGRGDALAMLEGRRPLVRDSDVFVIGVRRDDGALDELNALGIPVRTADEVRRDGAASSAREALAHFDDLDGLDGFWIHVDVDALDSAVMPAVDTPEPDGLAFDQLSELLRGLLADSRARGLEVTIFDPDLDEDGELAQALTDCICDAFTTKKGEQIAMPQTDAFLAEGPDPAYADKLQLFGQFVGSWDLVVTNHPGYGTAGTIPAEWHFAWALGGRATQDVWIAPNRAERAKGRDGEWGATLRFYDETIDAWRSTWIGPRNRVVMPFLGRAVGDEIVLEGSFEEGVLTRWIFSEITPESFSWRAVDSKDDGVTWILLQEMTARRRDAAGG